MKKLYALYAIFTLAAIFFVSCDGDDPVTPAPTDSFKLVSFDDIVEGKTNETLSATATIKNNTESEIKAKIKLEMVNLVAGHTLELDWANVNSDIAADFEAPGVLTLAAGATIGADDFGLKLNPNDVEGESQVKCIVFLEGTATDKVEFTVTFKATKPEGKEDPILKSTSLELIDYEETVTGPADGSSEIGAHAYIKNISASNKNVKIKMVMDEIIEGHQISLCWDNTCWPPTGDDFETGALEIAAGSTTGNEHFHAILFPFNITGTSIVKYIAYCDDDPDDKLVFYISFTAQ